MASPGSKSDRAGALLTSFYTGDVKAQLTSLIALRNHFFKDGSFVNVERITQALKANAEDQEQLIRRLVDILAKDKKTHVKLIDVSLSILGNVLLHEEYRMPVVNSGGPSKLMRILCEFSEEQIISRCGRAIANLAQNQTAAIELENNQVLPQILKTLTTLRSSKSKLCFVRAIRTMCFSESRKTEAIKRFSVVTVVSRFLTSEDQDLVKATLKCLAHFTHGAPKAVVEQFFCEDDSGKVKVLIASMASEKSSIWEPAMACVVNLCYLEPARTRLGAEGFIGAVVSKLNESMDDLSEKEIEHAVTALCLLCSESVNRPKVRESGGLAVFVRILGDISKVKLHDRIVNSLHRFAYDEESLQRLQNEGLIVCLREIVNRYTKKNWIEHDCAVEISFGDQKSECKKEEHGQEDEAMEEEVAVQETKIQQNAREKLESRRNERNESGGARRKVSFHKSKSCDAFGSSSSPERPKTNEEESRPSTSSNSEREQPKEDSSTVRFRVNSPSYMAVQDEFEQMVRIRHERSQNQQLNLSGGGGSFVRSPSSSPQHSNPYHMGGGDFSPAGMASPDRSPYPWLSSTSPGYSPTYSAASAGASPSRFSNKSFDSDEETTVKPNRVYFPPSYTPTFDEEDEKNEDDEDVTYSPVERFSDSEDVGGASPVAEATASPPKKKSRMDFEVGASSSRMNVGYSPPHQSAGYKSIFDEDSPQKRPGYQSSISPIVQQLSPIPSHQTFFYAKENAKLQPEKANSKESKENNLIDWTLKLLTRLSQMEPLHEDLVNIATTRSIVRYMTNTEKPLIRAGQVLIRIACNIRTVMTFVSQLHISWTKSVVDARPTLGDNDSLCNSCKKIFGFWGEFSRKATCTAESGYAEGEMCHTLMRGSAEAKHRVAISTPMVVKSRKKLYNILIRHEGLESLIEVLETKFEPLPSGDEEDLFKFAVQSVSVLAGYLGVVAPCFVIPEELKSRISAKCVYLSRDKEKDDVKLKTDSGDEIPCERSVIIETGGVFGAMLGGSFAEAGKNVVSIPQCSAGAIECIIHYLYGCRFCSHCVQDPNGLGNTTTLLELLRLSDQYLLPDFNLLVSKEIMGKQISDPSQIVEIYTKSSVGDYAVYGTEDLLSAVAVNYLLVGAEVPLERRTEAFRMLVSTPEVGSDFLEDVGRVLRDMLMTTDGNVFRIASHPTINHSETSI